MKSNILYEVVCTDETFYTSDTAEVDRIVTDSKDFEFPEERKVTVRSYVLADTEVHND